MAMMSGGGGGPATPSGTLDPGRQSLVDNAIRDAQSGGGGAGSGSAYGQPMWISLTGKPVTREVRTEGVGWHTLATGAGQQVNNIDAAIAMFYSLDDSYRESLMEKMWHYGLTDSPNDTGAAAKAWEDAATLAWNFTQAGKNVSPEDMIPRMATLKAGQLDPNAPRTVTSKTFNMLDPAQAKVFIRQSFQAAMGRDPHDAEIRQLIGTLQSSFKAHPSVMQITTGADGSTTQRVTDPGFGVEAAQAYVTNQLADDPEARASQAAATYYGALERALSSGVGMSP